MTILDEFYYQLQIKREKYKKKSLGSSYYQLSLCHGTRTIGTMMTSGTLNQL